MIEENPYEDRFERTFAFVDLSGFTTFTDRWGDKAAVEVLNDFRFLVSWSGMLNFNFRTMNVEVTYQLQIN